MINEKFNITKPVIVLVGPTAIGKTATSLRLASKYKCEIISLDSMQVYRYMDIGTAKVTESEKCGIAHHLIDIVNPDEQYDAKKYATDALEAITKIQKDNKIPLITGGTGLYLKALVEGLFEDIGEYPEIREQLKEKLKREGVSKLHEEMSLYDKYSAKRIHVNDKQRILRALEIYHGTGKTWHQHIEEQKNNSSPKVIFSHLIQLGLTCERNNLYDRINLRTQMMLKNGLYEEVQKLLAMGYSRDLKSMQSIGYKHMAAHMFDGWAIEKTEEILARDTRRYAKRQYTWFNRMDIKWFEARRKNEIENEIDAFLSKSIL